MVSSRLPKTRGEEKENAISSLYITIFRGLLEADRGSPGVVSDEERGTGYEALLGRATTLTLRVDDPNLLAAAARLRRAQWVWCALMAGAGATTWGVMAQVGPACLGFTAAAPWVATAALLAVGPQPALLALVCVQLALSMVALLPGVPPPIGPDPLARIFGGGAIEPVLLALVRLLLAGAAWSQFSFYRMLYGTATATGLHPSLPPIPEVIRNRSQILAGWASALGLAGLLLAWGALVLPASALSVLGLAGGAATYAIGLGLGAAFSPTSRRAAALTGVALGTLAFLSMLLAAQVLAA